MSGRGFLERSALLNRRYWRMLKGLLQMLKRFKDLFKYLFVLLKRYL